MSLWPFSNRRRGPRLKQDQPLAASSQTAAAAAQQVPSAPGVGRKLSKRQSLRSKNTQIASTHPTHPHSLRPLDEKEQNRSAQEALQILRPTSPMEVEFAPSARRRPSTGGSAHAEDITALPNSRVLRTSPHLRPVTQDTADIPYNWNLRTSSHNSLPKRSTSVQKRGKLQRMPSRNKRVAHDAPMARRRSSKKRKDDHLREEEIRAMSMPTDVPKRGADSGLLRRESKKSRGPLNRNLERPVSNISLPLEDSIHSSMSGNSGLRNYQLSTLAMISPRPAIRFSDSSQFFPASLEAANLSRKASRNEHARRTLHRRQPSKDKERDRARVDSLADELDATDLREILDRDQRRREQRREKDAERLKRRLERKAGKEKTKEVLQPEHTTLDGEGLSKNSGGVPQPPPRNPRRKTPASAVQVEKSQAEAPTVNVHDAKPEDPFHDAHETHEEIEAPISPPERKRPISPRPAEIIPAMPLLHAADDHEHADLATPFSELETPQLEMQIDTAQAVTYTSPPRTPVTGAIYHGDRNKASKLLGADITGGSFSRSNTVLDSVTRSKKPANPVQEAAPQDEKSLVPLKQDPELAAPSALKRKGGFLGSLFRSNRKSFSEPTKESISAQPSFSNTSREEMSRNVPSHLVQPIPITGSSDRARPALRTVSRFREDLPESPLSPPDSRVQSPVDPMSVPGTAVVTRKRGDTTASTVETEDEATSRVGSPDLATSGHAGLMSQSLASIDSEASWLSGRPSRRAAKHNSLGAGSLVGGSYEDLAGDGELFRRLSSPARGIDVRSSGLSAAMASHKASSTALMAGTPVAGENATSEREETTPEGKMKAGALRQPTVIHREPRVKSSEGLLNQYLTAEGQSTHIDTANDESEGDSEDGDDVYDDDKTPEAEYPTPAETPTEEHTRSSGEGASTFARATSVNLGKGHARNWSAGSAKLLDIKKNGSETFTSSQP